MFLGVLGRQLALIAPATVNEEEKAFLTEVAVSAETEWQEEEEETRADLQKCYVETLQGFFSELPPLANMWPPGQSSSSSAACAAAVPPPVSLSESETEEDALAILVESSPCDTVDGEFQYCGTHKHLDGFHSCWCSGD